MASSWLEYWAWPVDDDDGDGLMIVMCESRARSSSIIGVSIEWPRRTFNLEQDSSPPTSTSHLETLGECQSVRLVIDCAWPHTNTPLEDYYLIELKRIFKSDRLQTDSHSRSVSMNYLCRFVFLRSFLPLHWTHILKGLNWLSLKCVCGCGWLCGQLNYIAVTHTRASQEYHLIYEWNEQRKLWTWLRMPLRILYSSNTLNWTELLPWSSLDSFGFSPFLDDEDEHTFCAL